MNIHLLYVRFFFYNIPDNINLCALCFALLILYKGTENALCESIETSKLINSLLNTIVLTAISTTDNFVYWPTEITVTKITETGTCNQTTVALSTLLRVGFLNKTDKIPDNVLKERYRLVVNSLSWLTSIQTGDYNNVWAYGADCLNLDTDDSITYAVLSSHFCYETIKKYISFFNSVDGSNRIVSEINSKVIDNLQFACHKFEKWVEQKLDGSGGISKNNLSATYSVLHTCLCQIIYLFNASDLDKKKLYNAVNYVLDNLNDLSFKESDFLESYRYRYRTSDDRTGYKMDTYEIIPEFLFINYSTRLLKSPYSSYLSDKQKKKLQEANYIAYKKLLDKKEIRNYNTTSDCLCLKGFQSGNKKYPIYGLYDLQLCLLEFLNSSSDDDEITIIRRPIKQILSPFILIILIGIALFLISLNIDSKGTILGVLTGVLMMIVGSLPLIQKAININK